MRRHTSIVILVFVSATAPAQNIGGALQGVVKQLKDKELLPKPPQISPTQPQVNDPKIRAGELPSPDRTVENPNKLVVNHGDADLKGPLIVVTNGAEIAYRGYEIFGDRIEGNSKTQIFKAIGHVMVLGLDAFVKGDEVTVNLRNGTFLAKDSFVEARPSLLGGNIQRNLYVRGGQTYGTRNEIFGEACDVTSCDLEHPHYHLQAAKATIRPGRRAIFRKVSVVVLNKTIFKLPYLSIPLDERTYRYMPEVGQTFDEGYYAKFKFGIPLKGDFNFLDSHVDYYTKKGAGLGLDYSYNAPNTRGIATIYSVLGSDKTLNITSRHRSDFRFGTLTVDTNYQQNNYLSTPHSAILSSRIGFLIPQARGVSTRLGVLYNSNNSGGYTSESQTFTVNDLRRWTSDFKTTLDLGFAKSASSSGSFSTERSQLDVKFRAEQDLHRATAQFDYQRSIPVGDTSGFFSGSDRTPVISLLSDSRRLFGRGRNFPLPFNAELSLGEFANTLDKNRVTRANFDFNVSRPDRSNKRLKLDVNGRFKQGIYSDDTAQYVLGLGMVASYSLGYDTSFNIRYNNLRPYGFSPLSIDRIGKTNLLTADLSTRPYRTLLVGAQTGYDMLQLEKKSTAWQTIGTRLEYMPTSYISFRSVATYDTFQGVWNNLRVDLAYRPGATFVGVGAKYDGVRKVWSSAEAFVDGFKWGRLRTSAMLNYNGYLKRFEARHFQFTYDLHCAEAVLTVIDNPIGFRSGTSINFMLRLKAFPFNTAFGTGTSGQPVSLGN